VGGILLISLSASQAIPDNLYLKYLLGMNTKQLLTANILIAIKVQISILIIGGYQKNHMSGSGTITND